MCYNGKCMHCISIETGSLIFAIISIISTGLGILFVFGALVYLNVMIADSPHTDNPDQMCMKFAASMTLNALLGVVLCIIVVPFAFTIVLIKGLVQKKAGLVKVYFIYSVVSKGLVLFGMVMGILSGRYSEENFITVLVACGFYALILRMIYLTYKKLEQDAQFQQCKLIDEKY